MKEINSINNSMEIELGTPVPFEMELHKAYEHNCKTGDTYFEEGDLFGRFLITKLFPSNDASSGLYPSDITYGFEGFDLGINKSVPKHQISGTVTKSRDANSGGTWFIFKYKEVGALLKLLSDNELLTLDEVDGTTTLPEVFNNWIIPEQEKQYPSTDKGNTATGETVVDVYEVVEGPRLIEFSFGLTTESVNGFFLTQHQIVYFCKKYPHWLAPKGSFTYFPYLDGNEILVACLLKVSDSVEKVWAHNFFILMLDYPLGFKTHLLINPPQDASRRIVLVRRPQNED